MPDDVPPADLRRVLSERLLALPGVSGVGMPHGQLSVYLLEDSEDLRRRLQALADGLAPGTRLQFVVTGEFRPQA